MCVVVILKRNARLLGQQEEMIVEMIDQKGRNKDQILGKTIEAIKEFSGILETAFSWRKPSWGDQVTMATILNWSLKQKKLIL